MPDVGPLLGAELELTVGTPAHGGFCVARHEGRVVFVRHALPGEVVRARVTEDRGGSFCRADAVAVISPSRDRVEPPCPHAGPGRCGGCDWQHVSAPAQRALKAAVIREQFARLAGLDVEPLLSRVEPVGAGELLGWRTRIAYAVDADGRPGLHRHRSHKLEHVRACPLGVAGVGDADALARSWPGLTGVEVVRGVDGAVTVLGHRPGPGRQARGRRPPDRVEVVEGPQRVRHRVSGREVEVAAGGFWQAHDGAVDAFAGALIDLAAPRAGETVLELYAGAGPLTLVLADAVGPTGRVLGLESAPGSVADAAGVLTGAPQAQVRRARVDAAAVTAAVTELGAVDLVVLDPPRAGAGRAVMAAVLEARPRAVAYVACDPAALARDVRVAVDPAVDAAPDTGWRLAALRAFDAFPMTHHVECVALLEPAADVDRPGDAPGGKSAPGTRTTYDLRL